VACLSGPVGAPARKEKLLTSVEWRRLYVLQPTNPLTTFGIKTLGASVQFTYDAHNDEYGIDLPIYLVPNDKGGLTGGVRLGYKSEDHDIVAGVFVGAPFLVRP
jgi:hypothetical protein